MGGAADGDAIERAAGGRGTERSGRVFTIVLGDTKSDLELLEQLVAQVQAERQAAMGIGDEVRRAMQSMTSLFRSSSSPSLHPSSFRGSVALAGMSCPSKWSVWDPNASDVDDEEEAEQEDLEKEEESGWHDISLGFQREDTVQPTNPVGTPHMRTTRTCWSMATKTTHWKFVRRPSFEEYAQWVLRHGKTGVVPQELQRQSLHVRLGRPKKLARSRSHDVFSTRVGGSVLSFTMRDEDGDLVTFVNWQDGLGRSGRGPGRAPSLDSSASPVEDAVKKRANVQLQGLQLSLVAKKFLLKSRASIIGLADTRKEQNAAANVFDTRYADAQEIINDWISFRPPPRAHTVAMGDLDSPARDSRRRSRLLAQASTPSQKELSRTRYSLKKAASGKSQGGAKCADKGVRDIFAKAWDELGGDRGKLAARFGLELAEWPEELDKDTFLMKFT